MANDHHFFILLLLHFIVAILITISSTSISNSIYHHKSELTRFCQDFRSNLSESMMQGLSLSKTRVYLVYHDHIYEIPLTSNYIHYRSNGIATRMALFDRRQQQQQHKHADDNDDEQMNDLGHWLRIDWIRRITNRVPENFVSNWAKVSLRQITIQTLGYDIVNVNIHFQKVLDYNNNNNPKLEPNIEHIYGFNNTMINNQPIQWGNTDIRDIRVISETYDYHNRVFFRVHRDLDGQPVTTLMYPLPTVFGNVVTLEYDPKNKSELIINYRPSLLFESQSQSLSKLNKKVITSLSVYGFITHENRVQIWDIEKRKVYSFVHPFTRNRTQPPPLKEITKMSMVQMSFEEYFSCDEDEWKAAMEKEEIIEEEKTRMMMEIKIQTTTTTTKKAAILLNRNFSQIFKYNNRNAKPTFKSMQIFIILSIIVLVIVVLILYLYFIHKKQPGQQQREQENMIVFYNENNDEPNPCLTTPSSSSSSSSLKHLSPLQKILSPQKYNSNLMIAIETLKN